MGNGLKDQWQVGEPAQVGPGESSLKVSAKFK